MTSFQDAKSAHDSRLDEIVAAGPIASSQHRQHLIRTTCQFFKSSIGWGVLSSVLLYILLLCLKPAYVLKPQRTGDHGHRHVSFEKILVFSILGGASVSVIPYLAELA
jgi:hypothetical protein